MGSGPSDSYPGRRPPNTQPQSLDRLRASPRRSAREGRRVCTLSPVAQCVAGAARCRGRQAAASRGGGGCVRHRTPPGCARSSGGRRTAPPTPLRTAGAP
eukprot:scaffold306719_cov33-Tisochrysis_lutea.AAC.1